MHIVYIISLPRSGSTLLQKLLITARGYWTLPETWYLLSKSLVNVSRHGLVESGFRAHKNAITSYYNYLGIDFSFDFACIVSAYRNMLESKSNGSFHTFVEKTPRNILLVNEIYDSLSDGDKIIVLRRNSPDILASYLEYFDKIPYLKSYKYYKEINRYSNTLDMFLSRKDLDNSKIIQLDYEALVKSPETVSSELSYFLKTSLHPDSLGHIQVKKGVRFHGDQKQIDSDKISLVKVHRNLLVKRTIEFYYSKTLISWLILPVICLAWLGYVLNPRLFAILRHKNSFVH